MLYFTRWRALGIILIALVVCLCAVPNFFPEAQVKTWPAWAQRRMVLGLDLQGGSYLLLEVDSNYVKKEKLDQVRDDTRRVLREAKVGYTGLNVRSDTVEVRITKDTDLPTALAKLRELSQPLGGLLGTNGQLLMHFAAYLGLPWADYIQAMRDGVARHGPVRAGVYAMTTEMDEKVAGV